MFGWSVDLWVHHIRMYREKETFSSFLFSYRSLWDLLFSYDVEGVPYFTFSSVKTINSYISCFFFASKKTKQNKEIFAYFAMFQGRHLFVLKKRNIADTYVLDCIRDNLIQMNGLLSNTFIICATIKTKSAILLRKMFSKNNFDIEIMCYFLNIKKLFVFRILQHFTKSKKKNV